MIAVEKLTKWYGPVLAVDDVSFQVNAGEIVGFLGPNGAGKSTTLRILACYMPATSGRATVAGFDVLSQSMDVRRRVGYMPESVPLYGEMRVREYLTYRAALREIPSRQRAAAVDRVAERCWLSQPEDMMRRRLDQLSRGYKQRVGLADVLLHNPDVLILDEPTIGLDPAQIRAMREVITGLAGEHTVILSSHILAEVEQTCSKIIIIAGGKTVASGTVGDLRQRVVGPSRIIAEIKGGEPETMADDVRAVAGVRQVDVERAGNWTRLLITADSDEDARPAIFHAAADKNYTVRELRRQVASLEDFFVQITYDQNLQTTQASA